MAEDINNSIIYAEDRFSDLQEPELPETQVVVKALNGFFHGDQDEVLQRFREEQSDGSAVFVQKPVLLTPGQTAMHRLEEIGLPKFSDNTIARMAISKNPQAFFQALKQLGDDYKIEERQNPEVTIVTVKSIDETSSRFIEISTYLSSPGIPEIHEASFHDTQSAPNNISRLQQGA